jgi:hypothetical protein
MDTLERVIEKLLAEKARQDKAAGIGSGDLPFKVNVNPSPLGPPLMHHLVVLVDAPQDSGAEAKSQGLGFLGDFLDTDLDIQGVVKYAASSHAALHGRKVSFDREQADIVQKDGREVAIVAAHHVTLMPEES